MNAPRITAALIVAIWIFGTAFALEQPARLQAGQLLPETMLKGPHHELAATVTSDGYLNHYELRTDFGALQVHGNTLLKIRLNELDALAQLSELSKTEVFLESARDAGISQIKSLQSFAEKPVETVKAVPAGVGRLFKKVSRRSKEAYKSTKTFVEEQSSDDEASDETDEEAEAADRVEQSKRLMERYFGITSAERRWAERLGTDPYTSNEILRETIKEFAQVDRLGNLTARLAPIPSIPGVGYVESANKLAWSKDPYELRDYNRARLLESGAAEETVETFFENAFISPSLQTRLISALADMDGVGNRSRIIESAITLDSEVLATFFVDTVAMMARYHSDDPLASVLAEARLPTAQTRSGVKVIFAPVDYLFWVEAVEAFANSVDADAWIDVYLTGPASEEASAQMRERGWRLRQWDSL